jgi:hypothetical protein
LNGRFIPSLGHVCDATDRPRAESLDAPDDQPKEAPCQVAVGHLEDEAPSMPDEPVAPS